MEVFGGWSKAVPQLQLAGKPVRRDGVCAIDAVPGPRRTFPSANIRSEHALGQPWLRLEPSQDEDRPRDQSPLANSYPSSRQSAPRYREPELEQLHQQLWQKKIEVKEKEKEMLEARLAYEQVRPTRTQSRETATSRERTLPEHFFFTADKRCEAVIDQWQEAPMTQRSHCKWVGDTSKRGHSTMADHTARDAYRDIIDNSYRQQHNFGEISPRPVSGTLSTGPEGHFTAPTHTSLAFHTYTDTSRRLTDEDSLHRKCFEYSESMMRAAFEDVKSLREQRNDAIGKLNTANQQLHQVRKENELLKIENDKQTLRFEKARTDAERESRGAIAQLKQQNEQLSIYLNLLIDNFGLQQAGKPSEIGNGASEKPIGEVRRTAILKPGAAKKTYCDRTESIEQDGQRHAGERQQQPQPKQKLPLNKGRGDDDGSEGSSDDCSVQDGPEGIGGVCIVRPELLSELTHVQPRTVGSISLNEQVLPPFRAAFRHS
uniref:Uncharacterized protein n=1 Tax=Anopheles atroparvus TaxID=41427 RepID=A0A182JFW6_ANOAO